MTSVLAAGITSSCVYNNSPVSCPASLLPYITWCRLLAFISQRDRDADYVNAAINVNLRIDCNVIACTCALCMYVLIKSNKIRIVLQLLNWGQNHLQLLINHLSAVPWKMMKVGRDQENLMTSRNENLLFMCRNGCRVIVFVYDIENCIYAQCFKL